MERKIFYKVKEIALVCGVQKPRVRSWIIKGKLKGEKHGKEYLVFYTDLIDFIGKDQQIIKLDEEG